MESYWASPEYCGSFTLSGSRKKGVPLSISARTASWIRASNKGYPKVPEYFKITEKAPTYHVV